MLGNIRFISRPTQSVFVIKGSSNIHAAGGWVRSAMATPTGYSRNSKDRLRSLTCHVLVLTTGINSMASENVIYIHSLKG